MWDILIPAVQISIPVLFIIMNKFRNSKLLNLKGKLAMVTNGSNGLGQKICIILAQYGCNVIIVDSLPADETLKKLQSYSVKSKAFKVDMSNEEEILKLKHDVLAEFKSVDVLVNDATLTSHKTVFECSNEKVEKLMKSKFYAVKNMSNAFIDSMLLNNCGFVITLSGTHGLTAYPFTEDYSFTKFQILKFMNGLQEHLRRQKVNGIKVACISPKLDAILNNEFDSSDYLTSDEYIEAVLDEMNLDKAGFLNSKKQTIYDPDKFFWEMKFP